MFEINHSALGVRAGLLRISTNHRLNLEPAPTHSELRTQHSPHSELSTQHFPHSPHSPLITLPTQNSALSTQHSALSTH